MESNHRWERATTPRGANSGSLLGQKPPIVPPRLARVRKNEVAVLIEVDEVTSQLLGWSQDDMVGRTSLEFIHPDDQQLAVENWMQMLSSHGPGRTVRLRHKHRDGSWVWVEITKPQPSRRSCVQLRPGRDD